jgi:hypothetical protein
MTHHLKAARLLWEKGQIDDMAVQLLHHLECLHIDSVLAEHGITLREEEDGREGETGEHPAMDTPQGK